MSVGKLGPEMRVLTPKSGGILVGVDRRCETVVEEVVQLVMLVSVPNACTLIEQGAKVSFN